jgi:CheY-like chemotaxis protein
MSKLKLLLIDDEPELLEILELIIEGQFEVSIDTAFDGLQAINQIQTGDYDAIFCDLSLPKKSGVEVFMANKQHCNLPFIFMSGLDFQDNPIFEEFVNTNISNAFMPKPYFEEDIINMINTLKHNMAQ